MFCSFYEQTFHPFSRFQVRNFRNTHDILNSSCMSCKRIVSDFWSAEWESRRVILGAYVVKNTYHITHTQLLGKLCVVLHVWLQRKTKVIETRPFNCFELTTDCSNSLTVRRGSSGRPCLWCSASRLSPWCSSSLCPCWLWWNSSSLRPWWLWWSSPSLYPWCWLWWLRSCWLWWNGSSLCP